MMYIGILVWLLVSLFCEATVQKYNEKNKLGHSKLLISLLGFTIGPVIFVMGLGYGIFMGLRSALKRD